MHRLTAALGFVSLLPSAAGAQSNTDIYLAPLSRIGDSLVVGPAVNVTHRVGYDNQPSFTPDSRAILYTSSDSSSRSDIWRYDIAEHRTTRVTSTPESEYSPTVMPGGRRFSVIRVERDSVQRLWSFAMDGSDPQLVLRELKPVGYHSWIDSTHLAAFILGKPSTLHVVNVDGTVDVIAARDIGRALQPLPRRRGFSFTQRDSLTKTFWIVEHPLDGGGDSRLVEAPTDNEFHTWTADGVLLAATSGMLVRWNGMRDARSVWLPVADLGRNGAKNVSRLAVSPDGKWLAFVAEPLAR